MKFAGSEQRLPESLSLIDAVMPEVVASRQNQQNQHKQAIKTESAENANGEESTSMQNNNNKSILCMEKHFWDSLYH